MPERFAHRKCVGEWSETCESLGEAGGELQGVGGVSRYGKGIGLHIPGWAIQSASQVFDADVIAKPHGEIVLMEVGRRRVPASSPRVAFAGGAREGPPTAGAGLIADERGTGGVHPTRSPVEAHRASFEPPEDADRHGVAEVEIAPQPDARMVVLVQLARSHAPRRREQMPQAVALFRSDTKVTDFVPKLRLVQGLSGFQPSRDPHPCVRCSGGGPTASPARTGPRVLRRIGGPSRGGPAVPPFERRGTSSRCRRGTRGFRSARAGSPARRGHRLPAATAP